MQLRAYQHESISALRASLASGHRAPLLCAPTGCGKTTIAAEIIRSSSAKGRSVLFLAPRRELIYQASERFTQFGIAHGVIMAGEPASLYAPVQVASVDTLVARGMRRKRMAMPLADLLVIDEAHVVGKAREAVIKHYRDSVIVGMTATPTRGNGRGLGELYDDLIQVTSIRRLTDEGFLAPVRYFAPSDPDLAHVKLNKDGDYQEKQLGRVMDAPELVGDIVANWMRLAFGRSTVVFCVNRAHSRHVCEEFQRAGIAAEHVDGETPSDERKSILQRVSSGETTVLTNVFVASYGLDVPRLSCAALARPTKSLALYFQTCGRILRPFEGKDFALVIDHSGAVKQHGFLDEPQPWSLDENEDIAERKERQKKEAKKAKEISCAKCGFVFSGCRACPACGHAMIPPTEKIPVHEAELQEINPTKENKQATWDEKIAFMGSLKHLAEERGYNPGWAAHQYRNRFGVWPNDARVKEAPKRPCDEATRKWIIHMQIKRAKSTNRSQPSRASL